VEIKLRRASKREEQVKIGNEFTENLKLEGVMARRFPTEKIGG
jgi:hypothetical protein